MHRWFFVPFALILILQMQCANDTSLKKIRNEDNQFHNKGLWCGKIIKEYAMLVTKLT